MIDLNKHIFDDAESASTFSFSPRPTPPPKMAPKVAMKPPQRIQQTQQLTITILLDVKTREGNSMQSMQIKMRRDMSFGQLVTMRKASFEKTEDFSLCIAIPKSSFPAEWRMVFDSDTPASLHLTDRAKLQIVHQIGVEILDVSTV